ncbi:TAXI family TRAP transporter solute-binding subunit [Soehngenia longivitae]|uniref:TAXI family TRAP transporter solute-binding subunit n=1 Tax=Soehngenia longivitae TaxID=2562294 RepID=A0A4Z0D151_9FIRM|nr:TAXI family TRAP transporter solute-binding subunit [Soehngenia longivitae]TFZ39471.1 TAXI family TRAP transporter solute-binding subunit [Soehngenia longivitae]
MKKNLSLLLAMILIVSLVGGCSSGGDDTNGDAGSKPENIFISIATGGTGGTYYPLGGAIAKIFNENVEGVTANAQSTGASVENINLLSQGEAEVGFVQNDVTYYAWTGTETFQDKEKVTNIRGMAMLYPEVIQIIATKDSGIKSVEDLKGKKVAVGAPGSGTEVNARQILAEYGITYDDLGKADYLSFNEASDQLKNEQIDAAFVTAAIPTSAVTEVTQTADIVLVSLDKDKIESLKEKYPFYTEVTIPKDSYRNQTEDVVAAAVMAMLIVPEDLDEDLVYNMTKSIFENRQVIIDTHDKGNDIKLETALEGMPIDLHPGAEKYYVEQGIK